jgi:hypothetical protein
MADDIPLTDHGCRADRGRCFDRLDWEEATQSVYAYFRDGSEYRFSGVPREQALAWIGMADPGCYFNHKLWPGTFVRTRPPG